MTTATEISKKVNRGYKDVFLKRRFGDGSFDSSWTDITRFVASNGLNKIRYKLDSDDYDVGIFVVDNVEMTFLNASGKFNDPSDPRSLWASLETRHFSKVKIEAGYRDGITGARIIEQAFEGVWDERSVTISQNDTLSATLLSRDFVLGSLAVETGMVSSALLASEVIFILCSRAEIADFVSVTEANINPANDVVVDDPSQFATMKVRDALAELLLITNSVAYIDSAGSFIVRDREVTTEIMLTLRLNSLTGQRDNIYKIDNLNSGRHRVKNYWQWSSTVVYSSSLEHHLDMYGVAKKIVSCESITNTATRQSILDALLAEWQFPKREVTIDTDYLANEVELFDLVELDVNPLLKSYAELPICGLAICGTAECADYGAGIRIEPEVGWKVLAIEHDIEGMRTTLKLREVGNQVNDGYLIRVAPTVGTLSAATDVTSTSMNISWTAATPADPGFLEYQVVASGAYPYFDQGIDISTLEACLSAPVVMPWASSLSFACTGLYHAAWYEFAVLVRDVHGTVAKYSGTIEEMTEAAESFEFTVNTEQDPGVFGQSLTRQFKLPLRSTFAGPVYVDWGDSSGSHISAYNQAEVTHTYAVGGVKTIKIRPDDETTVASFVSWAFEGAGDRWKMLEIQKWGLFEFTGSGTTAGHFNGCDKMTISATDQPLMGSCSSLYRTFYGCRLITDIPNINNWDVGNITSLYQTFLDCYLFVGDLSDWDTSGVTTLYQTFINCVKFVSDLSAWDTWNVDNMSGTFSGCWLFNSNISAWGTSIVTTMANTFNHCTVFNQPIGSWDTRNVTVMSSMFIHAEAFNQDLSDWNVAKVTTMNSMFQEAAAFNGDITTWTTSALTVLSFAFYKATAFNQDIGSWDVSKVTTLASAFKESGFNQDIGSWDTGNVTTMANAFENSSFNQPIGSWNTAKVTTMLYMFAGSTFNQPIGSWNTAKVTVFSGMFSSSSFDQDISGWNVSKGANFSYMFRLSSFNQNIGGWSTVLATNMSGMFYGNASFNQNIGGWTVALLSYASGMFNLASSFNQNLGSWNVIGLTDATSILVDSGLSQANYDALLVGWSARSVKDSVMFGAEPTKYTSGSAAEGARTHLETDHGWLITDGGGA